MIEIDEKLVGIWFVPTLKTQDWMAGVSEIEPDKRYKLVYRFRYYDGDQSKSPFDDKDRKSWYGGEVTGTRHYVIASIRATAQMLAAVSEFQKVYETLMENGDVKDFMRRFQDQPFAFMRQEPLEK